VTDSLRIAVVGAGWIASEHLQTLPRLGAQVVAICDTDLDRAAQAAEPLGATAYGSADELLEREQLDSVFVCTPPLTHREIAVRAFERGLSVYLEKPIARTLEDGREITDAWRQSGSVCAVGYQWHALDLLDDVRAAVEGQRVALLVSRSIGPTHARPWFLDQAQGGGNLLERASHHVDLQRAVAGDVTSVQAAASDVLLGQASGEQGDIQDGLALVLTFESGAVGTVVVAWTRPGTPGVYAMDVVAEEATVQVALDPAFTLTGSSRGRELAAAGKEHPLERSVARFLEAAQARDPGLVFCTPDDALGTLAVCLACERALTTGETVAV
jgi:myo-inositol 2-dehydrogenase/D-chiro-inositol 1-dehydrogenase